MFYKIHCNIIAFFLTRPEKHTQTHRVYINTSVGLRVNIFQNVFVVTTCQESCVLIRDKNSKPGLKTCAI